MNIFVLSESPIESAHYMCNAHVVKMVVESSQLLSTYDRLNGEIENDKYNITHQWHPCQKCLSNIENYKWLCSHLKELLREYTYRYGKIHKCQILFDKYWDKYTNLSICLNKLSLPKCMPDEYKVGDNNIKYVVNSYRNYYKFKQLSLKRFQYRNRTEPSWLLDI